MIAFKRSGGIASDIRFVADDYKAAAGELTIQGDALPSAEALSDPAAMIAPARAAALALIDSKAGTVRMRYITETAGQQVTYLLKEKQSEAFKAAAYLGAVPLMVQAEADATGRSPQAAADAILAERDTWVNLKAPGIERERRKGKLAVTAAVTVAAINAARDAALAALDPL